MPSWKIAYLLPSSMLAGGNKVALQQAEELARRGHRVTVVSPEPSPAWFRLSRARFEQAAPEKCAALAEADFAVATFWPTVEPAVRRCRGKVLHLCQGYEGDIAFYRNLLPEIEAAYRLPTVKLAVSPHLRERLMEAGFGEASVIGQAFEAAPFEHRNRRWPEEPPRILVPGIYQGGIKGVPEALDALEALKRAGHEFRVVRVSPEPVTREERARGSVDEYHHAVPSERMPALYHGVDLFLGPSHKEEGFDLPALEALAAGLPAALSDTPAHRNSADGAALFFPEGDAAAIERQAGRLLDDADLRAELSAQGPKNAARFSTTSVADALEAVLLKIGSGRA